MELGTTIYFAWYDFNKMCEHVCSGTVVDNGIFQGTQWANHVYVSFTPPGLHKPICHHFILEMLSTKPDNVPHDDCYLVCGSKTRFFEHDPTAKLKKSEKLNTSDAWQMVQQFKNEHWDYNNGHIKIEDLEEFYQLWRTSVSLRHANSAPQNRTSYEQTTAKKSVPVKNNRKNVIELSLF